MKTSDPSLLLQGLTLLLIGPPGSGKTPLALQFPSVGVIDCDANLAGPMRYLISKNLYKPFKWQRADRTDDDKPIELPFIWSNVRRVAKQLVKDPEVQTIVLDSLTYCDTALYQHCCRTQGVVDLTGFMWAPYKRELHSFLAECKASGKTTIVTCHEKIEYDKKGNVEKYLPSISTGVSAYFSYYFSDIWRCTLEDPGAGKPMVMKVRTASTQLFDAKNSLLFSKELTDPSWAMITAAINKDLTQPTSTKVQGSTVPAVPVKQTNK